MNETEFKLKYPQYSHLEGDALWDKMTEVALQQDSVLYADPNQIKVYYKSVTLDLLQNDGTYAKSNITMEDSSTTRWLNRDGELVRVGEPKLPKPTQPTESYRMEIIDYSKL